MIKKIISTTLTRVFTALISFVIIVINARALGPDGIGHIGLAILNITIINLISGYIGGVSNIYFASRVSVKTLLNISLLSSFIGPFLFYIFILLIPNSFRIIILVSDYDLYYILSISFVLSLATNLTSIILGKEKVYLHNILTITQLIVLFVGILFATYILNNASVKFYFISFLISYIVVVVVSYLYILVNFVHGTIFERQSNGVIKEIFRYSFWTQSASLIQMFNYRLPYYFIQAYIGKSSLGIFTNANQISEALWIPSKSIAMVQYSKISNVIDKEYNAKLSLKLLKFSVLITFAMSLILILLPAEFYTFLFKHKEFGEIRILILLLLPGILSMIVIMITNHYFSGIGLPKINLIISSCSFFFMLVLSFLLIHQYGIIGASIATSVTYFVGGIMSVFYFFSISKLPLSSMLISKNDLLFFKEYIDQLKKK